MLNYMQQTKSQKQTDLMSSLYMEIKPYYLC